MLEFLLAGTTNSASQLEAQLQATSTQQCPEYHDIFEQSAGQEADMGPRY
jgi:hypothetical protein